MQRLRRTLLVGASCGLLLAAAVLAFGGGPAGAVGGVTSGYWWAAQGDSGVLPPPPHVPTGGLYVSSTAGGPQAISAVRFTLQGDEAPPVTLTLKVASANPSSQVSLAAYATTSSWSATQAGPWSQRPTYDPNGTAAVGALSADGTTVTFDLSSLAQGTSVNVVIVPAGGPVSNAPASPPPVAPPVTTPTTTSPLPTVAPPVSTPVPQPSPAPGGPTFDIAFNPVSTESVAVTTAAPPDTTPVVTAPPAEAAPALAPALPAETPAYTPLPIDTTPPATSPPPARPAARPRVRLQARPVATVPFGRSKRDRLILAFLLFDLALYLFWEGSPGVPGRPRLSLYDVPAREGAAVPAREGTPPPLR